MANPDTLPPSVRWIHRLRDALHDRPGRAIALALIVVTVVLLARGLYTVANGESAALLRFGRLVDSAVGPGLHLRLPAGAEEVVRGRTGEVFRHEIRGPLDDSVELLTADENLIDASMVVQYRIADLGEYLFATEDPRLLIDQTVRAALVEALATVPVDDVLTSAKAQVQQTVRQTAQARLDAYGAGVTVVSTNLQGVDPPREAAAAFRVVSDARAKAREAVNQAQGQSARALRLSRGEASQTIQVADADADARRQGAQGAADRYLSLLEQYRQAPGPTRTDLYHSTIRRVLPRTRLVLLAPGEVPTLDFGWLHGAPSPPAQRPPIPYGHEPE